jgi:hypothetical protein
MEASQSTVAQNIFKFADDVDTHGERTIGVLTKCDLVVTFDTDAFEAVSNRSIHPKRFQLTSLDVEKAPEPGACASSWMVRGQEQI